MSQRTCATERSVPFLWGQCRDFGEGLYLFYLYLIQFPQVGSGLLLKYQDRLASFTALGVFGTGDVAVRVYLPRQFCSGLSTEG